METVHDGDYSGAYDKSDLETIVLATMRDGVDDNRLGELALFQGNLVRG